MKLIIITATIIIIVIIISNNEIKIAKNGKSNQLPWWLTGYY